MKFLIVLVALFLTLAQGKKDKAIFGKSLTQKEQRKLQRSRAARRNSVTNTNAAVPEKRRLTKSRRQLPYHTYYGMFCFVYIACCRIVEYSTAATCTMH